MDLKKHKVSVELQCPTCGGTTFSGLHDQPPGPISCAGCGNAVSREELIARNQENVNAGVRKLGNAITNDVAMLLAKAFKRK